MEKGKENRIESTMGRFRGGVRNMANNRKELLIEK
jgi:hypothetical protein